MAIAPKLKNVQAGILVELLDQLANHDNSNVTPETLAVVIKFPVTAQFLETTTSFLEEKDYIDTWYDAEYDVTRVSITHEGVDFVQAAEDEPESDVHNYISAFHPALLDKSDIPDAKSISVEDVWEPLPIEREAPTTQNFIDSFQKAYEDIRTNNGYAERYPAERDGIVALLGSGLEWFKTEATITRMQFNCYVIEPLQKSKTRFQDSAISVLIAKAIEKAFEWLTNLPGA